MDVNFNFDIKNVISLGNLPKNNTRPSYRRSVSMLNDTYIVPKYSFNFNIMFSYFISLIEIPYI